MIIRGGENIQPTEIEDYIVTMEKVEDAYVIGVPNKRLQVIYYYFFLIVPKFLNGFLLGGGGGLHKTG